MAGWNFLINTGRVAKKRYTQLKALRGGPQKKGICTKLRIIKPKKPNSAQRKIARVRVSLKRQISAYIPGQGHNLREYSVVLIRGGRANDLPGVRYSLIRGKYDFYFGEEIDRRKKRSKYGKKLH